jgi:molybdopterin-guanine dinucleotide biosynthesis protein A
MTMNAALLAGGRNRKFGSDKALASFCGKPLVEYISEKFVLEGFNISVISKDVTKYLNVLSGTVEHVEDTYEEQSPMGGVITALEHCRKPVFVVSLDYPHMSVEGAKVILDELNDFHAVVPVINNEVFPFLAAYSPLCLNVLIELFDSGHIEAEEVLTHLNVRYVELSFFEDKGFSSEIFNRFTVKPD